MAPPVHHLIVDHESIDFNKPAVGIRQLLRGNRPRRRWDRNEERPYQHNEQQAARMIRRTRQIFFI